MSTFLAVLKPVSNRIVFLLFLIGVFVVSTGCNNRSGIDQTEETYLPVEVVSGDVQELGVADGLEVTNVENQDEDFEILHNEDGSFDTSNWMVCEASAQKIICPPDWHAIERGIANVPQEELVSNLPTKEGQITMRLAGATDSIESMQKYLAHTSDDYDQCTKMISKDLFQYMICTKAKDDIYTYSFRRIILEDKYPNSEYRYAYRDEHVSFLATSKKTIDENMDVINAIMEHLIVFDEKFIPPK